MQAADTQLHDIKPLIVIQDYTPYYLAAAAAAVSVLLLLVLYLLIRRYRAAQVENSRAACRQALEAVDFDDAKAAAYTITRLGRCFAEETPQHKEVYTNLARRLEPYKFRKTVPPIDEETRAYFRIYLGMIDV